MFSKTSIVFLDVSMFESVCSRARNIPRMSVYFKHLPRSTSCRPISCLFILPYRTYADQRASASHYDALGVSSTATAKEIKAAFYRLSKKHHPDVNPNDADAAKKFSTISNAYDILGDPVKRRDYDNELSSRGSSSDPYVTYDRTSAYAQRARAHRPSSWKPPSSRNASGGFQGAENAFGSFNKEQYDAAFGRYRGPTPSGRTNIYDFDEFYRAHYSEFQQFSMNRKEAQEKARRQRQEQEERRANATLQSKFSTAAIWISAGAFVLFLVNILHDMQFQKPSEELKSKFYLMPNSSTTKSSTKS